MAAGYRRWRWATLSVSLVLCSSPRYLDAAGAVAQLRVPALAVGVRIEDISRLVGHSGTAVMERVYRHELRPVLQEGAAAMDALFRERPRA